MSKYFDITIQSGVSQGPFTIWYTVNGIDGIATIVDTFELAQNLTYQQLIDGVRIFVPDNTSRIFVTDEDELCDDINFIELSYNCPVYFLTVSGLLHRYDPETNVVTFLYDMTTFGVQIYGFAMIETRLWLLGDGLLHEYDVTLNPFTIEHNDSYGPNSDLQQCLTISAVNGNYLYGMGTSLYGITPGVIPAVGGIAVQKITDLNPPGIIVDDVYYNPNTNSFLTLATDYSDFLNSEDLINQYNIGGDVTGTVNLTSQINPVVISFLYSHNNELYYVDKNNHDVYHINKETTELTYSHTMPTFSGIADYATQFEVCSDYSLPLII